MLNSYRSCILLLALFLVYPLSACAAELTPEQKQLVLDLKNDLNRIRQEIAEAKKEDEAYSGGLIKTLVAIRLEVLKTNEALVEQRIHALEGGVRTNIVINATKTNPERAAEIAKEIEMQKAKVTEARREADRYSGGLVQAMSEAAVATARNTLAMLEQQYVIAQYGLALPAPPSADTPQEKPATSQIPTKARPSKSPQVTPEEHGPKDCLKIQTFDSSVLSTNDVYTELAWKVDVANSCAEPFGVRVIFTIYDKDDFELDSDNGNVYVQANSIAKARGKMLVSPPEKARRMAKQGASISAR